MPYFTTETCGGSGVLVFILTKVLHLLLVVQRHCNREVLCQNKWYLQLVYKTKISLGSEDDFCATVALYVGKGSAFKAIMERKPRDRQDFQREKLILLCIVIEVLYSTDRNSFHWVPLEKFQLLIVQFALWFVKAVLGGRTEVGRFWCWMDEATGQN